MAKEYRQNTSYDDFQYDPEATEGNKKYRLPFALCQAHGIAIQDWWTPRNAWDALKNGGVIDDVSDEYKEFYRELKKKRAKEHNKKSRERSKRKKQQLADPLHNPDREYSHQEGKIAGVDLGEPMDFEKADNGNCNPYFNKGLIGYYTNCQTCVATYVARRQGYDLRALPNLNNRNIANLSSDTSLAYVDSNGNKPIKVRKPKGQKTAEFLEQSIAPGEIFSLEYNRKGSHAGHIIIAEKDKNGELFLYDPQVNLKMSKRDIPKYINRNRAYGIDIMNLTNVKMNEQFCDAIMKGSK